MLKQGNKVRASPPHKKKTVKPQPQSLPPSPNLVPTSLGSKDSIESLYTPRIVSLDYFSYDLQVS